jgi:hypothetical protein
MSRPRRHVRAAPAEQVGWGMHVGWMDAYVYAADLYCEDCGRAIQDELKDDGHEDTGDSEEYPQGPYPDGGGESDGPAHCGADAKCINAMTLAGVTIGAWLGNPLTEEGVRYLQEMLDAPNPSPYQRALHDFWRRVYADYLPKEEDGGEVDEARREHLYVWQITLQVTSPERPNLRHDRQYRVQALSGDREGAIAKAKAIAERDGLTVVDVTGAARGYRIRTEELNEAHTGQNQGMSATAFIELLSSLTPPDRQTRVRFQPSIGGERGGGSVYVNFVNLPTSAGRAGGGAEAENNRASFWVEGFQYDPAVPVATVKVDQSSNVFHRPWLGAPGVPFRAKTGSPDAVARYLAAYLEKVVATVLPRFTHTARERRRTREARQIVQRFLVDDYVVMSDDAISNYGDQWRDVVLVITHVATSHDDHPGFDPSSGSALYDFIVDNTGKHGAMSLYDWELEPAPRRNRR